MAAQQPHPFGTKNAQFPMLSNFSLWPVHPVFFDSFLCSQMLQHQLPMAPPHAGGLLGLAELYKNTNLIQSANKLSSSQISPPNPASGLGLGGHAPGVKGSSTGAPEGPFLFKPRAIMLPPSPSTSSSTSTSFTDRPIIDNGSMIPAPPSSHVLSASGAVAMATAAAGRDAETNQSLEAVATTLGRTEHGYRCIYCQKIYSRKYGLKIHLRTHTGFKPLKCKVCSRAFSDPSNLNKHTRLHQEHSSVKCGICGKGLARGRDLERHMQTRHPENQESRIILKTNAPVSESLQKSSESLGVEPFMAPVGEKDDVSLAPEIDIVND